MRKARAVVQIGPRALEMREFDIPPVGPEDGLLRVDACGICGSDWEQYQGAFGARSAVIPGHEFVGTIEEIGDIAAQRWGVAKGDRVAVESFLPCGHCRSCLGGEYRLCTAGGGALTGYGYLGIDRPPSIWGGYADYVFLQPNTILHKIDRSVPPEIAVLFNPLGAGFRWAVDVPRLTVGETIVILGPGQRGLASVLAAREAGAGQVIVTGLPSDEEKMALAREFGADATIDVTASDPIERVRELTDGAMADVVIDLTPLAGEAVNQAIGMARRGGRIVLAGTKGRRPVPDFISDTIVMKELTIMGVLGVDFHAYKPAIKLIESGKYPLERMHTHTLPLEEAEYALKLLAREIPGEDAIHVALRP